MLQGTGERCRDRPPGSDPRANSKRILDAGTARQSRKIFAPPAARRSRWRSTPRSARSDRIAVCMIASPKVSQGNVRSIRRRSMPSRRDQSRLTSHERLPAQAGGCLVTRRGYAEAAQAMPVHPSRPRLKERPSIFDPENPKKTELKKSLAETPSGRRTPAPQKIKPPTPHDRWSRKIPFGINALHIRLSPIPQSFQFDSHCAGGVATRRVARRPCGRSRL